MNSTKQPSLADLTNRAMIARTDLKDYQEFAGDVEPHDVVPGIRVDARAAWIDAQLATQLLGSGSEIATQPADWAAFVGTCPPRLGIPLATGQFPQRLRDVSGLFAAKLVEAISPAEAAFQTGTINSDASQINQRAAALWLNGKREDALAMWETLPVGPVASFNVGMALLMLGRSKSAVPHLASAVDALPEASSWKHLASLYLSVARVRG